MCLGEGGRLPHMVGVFFFTSSAGNEKQMELPGQGSEAGAVAAVEHLLLWSRGRSKPPREQERVHQPEPEEPQHEDVAAGCFHSCSLCPCNPTPFLLEALLCPSRKFLSLELSTLGVPPPKPISVCLWGAALVCVQEAGTKPSGQ